MRQSLIVIPVFILSLAFYILYTGGISVFDIVTGLLVAIVISALTAEVVVKNPGKALNPMRLLYLAIYTVWYFLVAETKAHIDVVKRALSPRPKYNPAIVKVPYNVRSAYAITLIANSITNTPGTVVVDVDTSKKIYYVHWIDAKTRDPEKARSIISSRFEEYAGKIFD